MDTNLDVIEFKKLFLSDCMNIEKTLNNIEKIAKHSIEDILNIADQQGYNCENDNIQKGYDKILPLIDELSELIDDINLKTEGTKFSVEDIMSEPCVEFYCVLQEYGYL